VTCPKKGFKVAPAQRAFNIVKIGLNYYTVPVIYMNLKEATILCKYTISMIIGARRRQFAGKPLKDTCAAACARQHVRAPTEKIGPNWQQVSTGKTTVGKVNIVREEAGDTA
jgi:hypothetical protein